MRRSERAGEALADILAVKGPTIPRVGSAQERDKALGCAVAPRTQEALEPVDAEASAIRLAQPVREPARHALQAERQAAVLLPQQNPDVASVSRKQLIAADSRERHLIRGTNRVGQKPRRNRGIICVG